MSSKKNRYINKPSTRDYLVALIYHPNFVKLLDTNGKLYKKLIGWILDKEIHLKEDNFSLPSIKQIAEELDMKTSEVTKYLKMIYDDIVTLNHDNPDVFKKEGQYSCGLSFNYIGEYFYFNLGLDVIPNVGDHFDIYFVKPMISGTGFYVNKIYHDIDYRGHSITLSLNSEIPNNYLKLLKEKAFLQSDISFMEYIQSDTSDKLKQELIRMYKNL